MGYGGIEVAALRIVKNKIEVQEKGMTKNHATCLAKEVGRANQDMGLSMQESIHTLAHTHTHTHAHTHSHTHIHAHTFT